MNIKEFIIEFFVSSLWAGLISSIGLMFGVLMVIYFYFNGWLKSFIGCFLGWDKYGRLLVDLIEYRVDIIKEGLAKPYFGGKK